MANARPVRDLGREARDRNYDVMPDGRSFMVKNDPDAVPTRIDVIFDWFEELRRLVPATE